MSINHVRMAQAAIWEARIKAAEGGSWVQQEDGVMVYLSRTGEPMVYASRAVYERLVAYKPQRASGSEAEPDCG